MQVSDLSFVERAREYWSCPPLESVGNHPVAAGLAVADDELRAMVAASEAERYGGWRNAGNRWRDIFHTGLSGRRVIDYGCGWGLEALQLARAGANVVLMDIVADSVFTAARVLALHGFALDGLYCLPEAVPGVQVRADVFYANGVLHHIPEARAVLAWASDCCPEARLLLYNEEAWRWGSGAAELPADTQAHRCYQDFLRRMDAVGEYAEWYDRDKLGGLAASAGYRVESWEPIGEGARYGAAVLWHP